MVRFDRTNHKIFIEIDSAFPAEDWRDTMVAMLNLISSVPKDNLCEDYYNVINFMAELFPDTDTVLKMEK